MDFRGYDFRVGVLNCKVTGDVMVCVRFRIIGAGC